MPARRSYIVLLSALAVWVLVLLGLRRVARNMLSRSGGRRPPGNVVVLASHRKDRRWRLPGAVRGLSPRTIGIAVLIVVLGVVGFLNEASIWSPNPAAGYVVEGPVTHIRDGDTIEVRAFPIRFETLDCAESGTAEGNRATIAMRELVAGQTLTCRLTGRRSYDCWIGSCELSDGRDVATEMIRGGYCGRWW